MNSRTSQKQVQAQIDILNRQTGLDGYFVMSAQYGYYGLQMYTLDNEGKKSSGVRTVITGLTLGQLSDCIACTIEVNYQTKRLKEELVLAEVREFNRKMREQELEQKSQL
jgi:diacylglycerol kinase family enzyme